MVTDNPAITISNLVKNYKGLEKPAIDRLTLNIGKGEIFGLLGPNGAGKTTAISILSGLMSANEGEVSIFDFKLSDSLPQIKKIIGVVPQEIALYPTLTAKENLRFFGAMLGIGRKDLKKKINWYLQLFGLDKNSNMKVSSFSGGMKRRLNLIVGILSNPVVLILDEPTVGIDVQSKNVIIEYLKELNRSGTTIVYTSHLMDEAENFCSRVAIIDSGKLIAIGSPQELKVSNGNLPTLEAVFIKLTGKALRD